MYAAKEPGRLSLSFFTSGLGFKVFGFRVFGFRVLGLRV